MTPLPPPRKINPVLALSAALLAGMLIGLFAGPDLRRMVAGLTAPRPDRLVLRQVSYDALPGWRQDSLQGFMAALNRSCGIFLAQKPDRPVGPDGRMGRAADWKAPCAALAQWMVLHGPGPDRSGNRERDFIMQHFLPLQALNNEQNQGRFTGYYEPELRGSLVRQGPYQVALLRAPENLVAVNLGEFNPKWRGQRIAGRVQDGRLRPLQPRAEIVAGALDAEKLELLYVDDPVDAFFLHIQGSGRVRLQDGRVIRVGYAGQNGHPYAAIGKNLVKSGAIRREDVSMQSIRAWLEANPDERDAVMNANPSYIFFQELAVRDPGQGPPGAQNVPLTPGRSLAVDPDFHALGTPVWLDSATPDGEILQRLMVAQDTGGAIRGPVRGDVFWGAGAKAAQTAGHMNSEGRMYILVPRAVAARAIDGTS